jgi:dephospho-CoA kinase
VVVERLMKERGLSREEVVARIRSQTSNEDRIKYADVVIRNDGSREELKAEVTRLWDTIKG